MDKFVLLTTLYNEKNQQRIQEYINCIESNLNNSMISDICILYEGSPDDNMIHILDKYNIIIEYINERPTYKTFFDYSSNNFSGRKIIITNADIYYDYDKGLNLIKDIDLSDKFLVLTRYNKFKQLANPYQFVGIEIDHPIHGKLKSMHMSGISIDSWIYMAPVIPDFNPEVHIGVVFCDSMINSCLMGSNKYKVYNPCKDVISIHDHSGWNPVKYNTVRMKNGEIVSQHTWRSMCINRGYGMACVPFCHVSDIPRN